MGQIFPPMGIGGIVVQFLLVYQGRGLQGVARWLMIPLLCCQAAQLLVDQGQELIRGLGVILFDGFQDMCYVTHSLTIKCTQGPPMLRRR